MASLTRKAGPNQTSVNRGRGSTDGMDGLNGYLSEKVTYWFFKIFEIQKGRTFSFNDILRLCTIVVNIAIRIRA